MRLRFVVPGRRRRQGLGGLALRRAGRAAALVAALLLAGCGGEDDPRPIPPEKRTEAERRGLAIGLVEPNPNLLWSKAARPALPAGFAPMRDRVEALRPAHYRLVINWSVLQPDAARPPDWSAPRDGCMRGIAPCGSYAGVREVLEAVRSQQEAHGGWDVSVLIYGAPRWAAHGPRGCERPTAAAFARPSTERGLEGYRSLVRSLLELGREVGVNVRWWSPWNEPNHPAFISPQRPRCDRDAQPVAPGVYSRLARALHEELERAPGDQRLVLGDFAGLPRGSDKSETITEFVNALPADVICLAGAWATHAYADPGRAQGTSRANPVRELERVLARHRCARRAEIRVTETGAGAPHAGDERPRGEAFLRDSCRAMADQLELWNRDPRVSVAFQYTFRDDPAFPVGLVDPGLQRAYPTYDLWLAWGGTRNPGDPAPGLPGSCR